MDSLINSIASIHLLVFYLIVIIFVFIIETTQDTNKMESGCDKKYDEVER